ncbi:hypothetical protein AX15_001612 [Amanita polypyramis BW_CC]|nr:hypothetical protein AX15_001612 [Amanita polypyramis BW_CC]
MAERNARVYTHSSNRASATSNKERKVTFKSALDTPFRVSWPKVSPNVQSELLTHLVSILEGVADYQVTFRRLSRKRKRASNGETSSENQEEEMVGAGVGDSETQAKLIVNHLVVGLNAVTKRVEMQVRKRPDSKTIIKDEPATGLPDAKSDLRLIFACRADVDPPLLIDHLPHLVAACNAMQEGSVRLASLPKGAEMTLAKALGVRRVAVIGLDTGFPALNGFERFYKSIPILSAGWLSSIRLTRELIPTHVKQVKTSAPRDMKEAKEERKKGRAQAKQRKRIKIR